MDNLPSNEPPLKPTVQIIQNSFLKTTKGKIITFALGIILLTIATYTLNYFNLLPFSKKPITNLNQTPVTVKKLTLSCPVPSQYCKEGKQINFNNHPAISYNLPTGTKIFTVAPAVDLITFSIAGNKAVKSLGIRQTSIVSNDCYTTTYLLSKDTKVKKIELLPLNVGEDIATSGASLLESPENSNLVIQLQKREIDPATANQPDFKRCPVANIKPTEIGDYQNIDPSQFE